MATPKIVLFYKFAPLPDPEAIRLWQLALASASDLRGRIKIAAFKRGVTVADMLRDLLAREFPSNPGDPS